MKLRFWIALWAGKLSRPLLKITRHNGTNFPGELAIKICPDFLKYVSKPAQIIAVTGTNGKTTVSNLVNDILEQSGKKVLNNRAGSNINSGIATSLLTGVGIFNRSKYDMAVLEVDERSSKKIYPYVQPDYMVITNLFRDSIMRNAHPQYIADFLTSAIPAKTKLILNADDLISSSVSPENPRAYFGLMKMDTDVTECINLINDMQICPKCSGELTYDYLRYHHIGKARCKDCGFAAPEYNYYGKDVDLENMTMTVSDGNSEQSFALLSDSIFNIYNMVTVVALMRELGMPLETVHEYMSKTQIVGTRYYVERAGNVNVIMQMAKEKNALACSRAFDYVSHQSGKKEIYIMMHCYGDEKHWSENTCWMYDCDFEFLANDDITHIVATGPRMKDYRLRLLLAGVPDDKITCARDELEAVENLHYEPDSNIYIFYGTDGLAMMEKVKAKTIQCAKEAAK